MGLGAVGAAVCRSGDEKIVVGQTLMVRRDVALSRIGRASTWLTDADRLFAMDVEQFRDATKDRDLAIFYLFLALQECIDLAAYWVADAG